MRIVLHGQQAFGQAVLEKLLERGEDVVAVCCAPTKEGKLEDVLATYARKRFACASASILENAGGIGVDGVV